MENAPVPKNENQTDKPFDFSKYSQPEVDPAKELATESPFDFSEYNQSQAPAANQLGEFPIDFNRHVPTPTAEERIVKAEQGRLWDFSDKNIAETGEVRRDMTTDEIAVAEKAEAENASHQRQVGGGVLRQLVSFGRRK